MGNTSGFIVGRYNPWECKMTVDIKTSTTLSTYGYDVNFIVGGQTDGSIFANNEMNIKNGNIGRVLRW